MSHASHSFQTPSSAGPIETGELLRDCSHWLEVRDGETSDPIRPLIADRVLIGSGSNCHVQIASNEVAMIHAVLTRQVGSTAGQWAIEALASEPAVLINGTVAREHVLQSGDLIGLAGVNLEYVVAPPRSVALEEHASDDATHPLLDELADATSEDESDVMRPAALSPGELVDALQRDLRLIGELTVDDEAEADALFDEDLADVIDDVFEAETATDDAIDEDIATLEMPSLEPPIVPSQTGSSDPYRVRGLGALLQAARDYQADASTTATIPIRTAAIVPNTAEDQDDADRRVA